MSVNGSSDPDTYIAAFFISLYFCGILGGLEGEPVGAKEGLGVGMYVGRGDELVGKGVILRSVGELLGCVEERNEGCRQRLSQEM